MKTDTRNKLIQTSIELMTRKGFNNTGIGQILKEAKVPKGSFYYYFESKDDLGYAVIEESAAAREAFMQDFFQTREGSALEKLRAFFEHHIELFNENFDQCNCIFGNLGQELAVEHEAFREKISCVFKSSEDGLAELFKEAQAHGELSTELNVEHLAEFLFSGWEGALLRAKLKKSVEPLKVFVQLFFEQLLVPPANT